MSRRFLIAFLSILITTTLIAGSTPVKRRSVPAGGASEPLHYLAAYDSALQSDWNITKWDDPDHLVVTNPDVDSPGRPGRSIEVRYSNNGYGAFGLANMSDWNHVHTMYLNEFRTIELDLFITSDATGMDNLHFILEDAGASSQPKLVSFIAGWNAARPEASAGRWIPIRIDLHAIGATVPSFMRFLFYNDGSSRPHFYISNVRLGWSPDTTPPSFTSVSATPSLTHDKLTLAFTNDKATTWRVEYGAGAYDHVLEGDPSDLKPGHSAILSGLARGNTYRYRITARAHESDPATPPPAGVYEGTWSTPPVSTTAPVIGSFIATPSETASGESPRLTWQVTDYDTLAIDHGVGSVAQIAGSTGVLVRPAQTTTWTLSATNAIGTSTRTVTVIMHPVPTVSAFTASPAKIGAGATSVLNWNVADFDHIAIDHGVGDVTGTNSIPVHPNETTTYVLTASNAYGTVRETVTVTKDVPATNPIWVMGYYIGYHRAMQPPDKVDYPAMTHVILGPAIPTTSGTWETHFYIGDVEGPAWARETVQRAHAAGTRALLMLGGAGSVDGFLATSNPSVRAAFVSNLKSIVEAYGFDGVDLDWEPLNPSDRSTAIALMQALQAPNALPRSNTIYTLPVGWNNMNWDNMADPFFGEIATYFDRVTPMTYSMMWLGDGWDSWHTGALYGETPNAPSSIGNTVQALLRAGVPAAKLGIGIGFYGDSVENGTWTSAGWQHLEPPAIPSYITAPHQNTNHGIWRYGDNALSYSNIMRYLHSGAAYRWDETARVPYLSFSTPTPVAIPGFTTDMRASFVTYDNEQSIAEKGSYVKQNGLGGVMIWTISEGYLGSWKTAGELDPLMKAVVAAFR